MQAQVVRVLVEKVVTSLVTSRMKKTKTSVPML
jgi:hypothetical protein